MDPIFAWIESTALSNWLRASASLFAFPGVLVLHTLGMGFLVGAGIAIALRVLGVAASVPVAAMVRFFPVLWLGLAANVVSGVLLLIAYPTKALTNPVFYAKMSLLGLALASVWRLRSIALGAQLPASGVPTREAKIIAAALLLFWAGAITTGRFLAYTHTRMLVDRPVAF